jgi:nitroreductase
MGAEEMRRVVELATGAPSVHNLVVGGTDFDGPAGWLAAGQVTARVLLRVTACGVAASPIGQVLDLPWTREQFRLRLGLLGHPRMLLRLGYAPLASPATPRRPVEEVLDVGLPR